MADEKDCKCGVVEWAKAIGIVIAAIGSSIAAGLGAINHGNIDDVKNQQGVQVQRAENIRETLEQTTESTDAKLGKIQKSTTALQDSLGPTLWSAWKYAESISDFDPTPTNLAKTAEAKAAYDAHLKKKSP